MTKSGNTGTSTMKGPVPALPGSDGDPLLAVFNEIERQVQESSTVRRSGSRGTQTIVPPESPSSPD
jgi:hypothetical protein